MKIYSDFHLQTSVPRSLWKTASFEEHIIFKNKYLSIFFNQMEAAVFIILQMFFTTRAVLKIGKYYWHNIPQF